VADKTGIAWTDHTFNPWWGCFKVSPGCKNCYAETLSNRYGHDVWGPAATTQRRTFGAKHWNDPLVWNARAAAAGERRRVFSGSMCDVFEDHPTANLVRPALWELIRQTPYLDWQLLTKRPENIIRMLPADWNDGYPNVWLGTSVEDQERANERIPVLCQTPALLRFLSCEPLLGPIDFYECGSRGAEDGDPFSFSALRGTDGGEPTIPGIDWVIVGGESGAQRRPMELHWLCEIVNDCQVARVPVFVKQDGAFKSDQRGRIPDSAWVREFPQSRTATVESSL
jgi:protein gp37